LKLDEHLVKLRASVSWMLLTCGDQIALVLLHHCLLKGQDFKQDCKTTWNKRRQHAIGRPDARTTRHDAVYLHMQN